MAFNKEIRELANYAAKKEGYVSTTDKSKFSFTDVSKALRAKLTESLGDYYKFQKNKNDLYALLSGSIDEVLPETVINTVGIFAETKIVKQGEKIGFKRKLGRKRAKQFVGRVSPAGIYETFRLDREEFDLPTYAIGGAIRIDWERYLDGTEDWNEMVEIVLEGLEEEVYKEIHLELLASYDAVGRPENTKVSTASFDGSEMKDLMNVIRSYGEDVVIFAPWQFVNEMAEDIKYGPADATQNVATEDINDLRNKGFIGRFSGAPVISLPNTFTDEKNEHYQLNPRVAFVMPAGKEKVVKVGFEGQTIIKDIDNDGDFSMEMSVYKKMGTALLYTNNWGIYEITSISDTDWAQLA